MSIKDTPEYEYSKRINIEGVCSIFYPRADSSHNGKLDPWKFSDKNSP